MKVHQRRTLPILKEGVSLPPGHESTIHISEFQRELMQAPYGSCTKDEYLEDNDDETGYIEEDESLLYKYNDESCKELMFQEDLMEACDCVSQLYEFSDKQLHSKQFCSMMASNSDLKEFYGTSSMMSFRHFPEHIKALLFKDMRDVVKKLVCTLNQTRLNLTTSDCPTPCVSQRYKISISQAPWPLLSYHLAFWEHAIRNAPFSSLFSEYENIQAQVKYAGYTNYVIEQLKNTNSSIDQNFLLISLSFEEESVVVSHQQEALTWEVLFANLGGALNLWIGISFMTFIELSELVYHLLMLCCGRGKDTDTQNIKKVSPASSKEGETS